MTARVEDHGEYDYKRYSAVIQEAIMKVEPAKQRWSYCYNNENNKKYEGFHFPSRTMEDIVHEDQADDDRH